MCLHHHRISIYGITNDHGIHLVGIDKVAACTAVHLVSARTAIQHVIAVATPESVTAVAAEDHIVTAATFQHIGVSDAIIRLARISRVRAAVDLVVAVTTLYGVIPEVTRQDIGIGRTGEIFDIGKGYLDLIFILIRILCSC